MLLGERCQFIIPFKLLKVIIDLIVTMSFIYGHCSLNIRGMVRTLQQISCDISHSVCRGENGAFFAFLQIDKLSKLYFAINVLNNETVIELTVFWLGRSDGGRDDHACREVTRILSFEQNKQL